MKVLASPGNNCFTSHIAAIAIFCLLFCHTAHAYNFGDGYDLGNFHFSGYSNVELEFPRRGHDELSVDELSLFASGEINRYINPFIEVELAKPAIWESGHGVQFNQSYLVLERLYNDFEFTENDTVRIGKMLTPVGEWNMIHAEPLVWTTIRPVSTYYSFSEFTSGLSYRHLSASIPGLAWEIYTQPAGELLRKPKKHGRLRNYREVVGINVDYNLNLSEKFGISGQHAKVDETGEEQWLLSIDGQLLWKQLKLEFQATETNISGGSPSMRAHDNEWGGYLQLVHNFYGHWNLVGRVEYFQAREYQDSNRNALIGLVYRPSPAIAYKFQYLSSHGAGLGMDSGLYGSIAILF